MDATVAAPVTDMDTGVTDETKRNLVGSAFPESTIRRKIKEVRSAAEGNSGDDEKKHKTGLLSKEQPVLHLDIAKG